MEHIIRSSIFRGPEPFVILKREPEISFFSPNKYVIILKMEKNYKQY